MEFSSKCGCYVQGTSCEALLWITLGTIGLIVLFFLAIWIKVEIDLRRGKK